MSRCWVGDLRRIGLLEKDAFEFVGSLPVVMTLSAMLLWLGISSFFDFHCLLIYIFGIANFVFKAAKIVGLQDNLSQGFFS